MGMTSAGARIGLIGMNGTLDADFRMATFVLLSHRRLFSFTIETEFMLYGDDSLNINSKCFTFYD